MSDFNLDVTKPPGETVTITTPVGEHVYDVLPFTRSRILAFDKHRRLAMEVMAKTDEDVTGDDAETGATSLIEAISTLLGTKNGGPPAQDVLRQLWDDDYLSFRHLETLTEHLQEKAGTSPPA